MGALRLQGPTDGTTANGKLLLRLSEHFNVAHDALHVQACVSSSRSESKRRLCGIAEESMQRRHNLCALADRGTDPFDRPGAHVTDREHARHRGLQRRHRATLI